jgi:hypothetical protein
MKRFIGGENKPLSVTPTLFMFIKSNVMQPCPCSLLLLLATYVPRPSSVVHTVDLFVRGRRENVLFSLFHSIYLSEMIMSFV